MEFAYPTVTTLVPANIAVIGGAASTAEIRTMQGEIRGVPGEVFGYFMSKWGVNELRYHERIPTGYAWMGRSYGTNHVRNGLAIREAPDRGFGLRVEPVVSRHLQPRMEKLTFEASHGVGVNDRTNGVAGYIADGAEAIRLMRTMVATLEDPEEMVLNF